MRRHAGLRSLLADPSGGRGIQMNIVLSMHYISTEGAVTKIWWGCNVNDLWQTHLVADVRKVYLLLFLV